MTTEVKVTLHSATGSRTESVNPKGFPTRHIRTGTPAKTEPLTITPNPKPVDADKDPNAVRVYAVNRHNRKRKCIHIGESEETLQAYANAHDCWVEWHIAAGCRVFHPNKPTTALPTGDAKPSKPLKALLQEVDAILDGGVENA